ncbi:hypothetical protein [Massilia endophytica]|uniref:hypothetical protein n=1 Tax=Massilia endophytica TaxID=2899220 RepID=UPI001E3E502C|nr:hypothetical protein [Massilia endophytica]UGQ46480.1 hypothetical protein LSQ66_22385 [Massilia endophytica]
MHATKPSLFSRLSAPPPAAPFTPPEGWSLIDTAVHPSGETTIVLGNGEVVRLLRLNRLGKVLRQTEFSQDTGHTDLTDQVDPADAAQPAPRRFRDAVRLRAIGEAVTMVLRTGRNGVLVYRLSYCVVHGYKQLWRTLVNMGRRSGDTGAPQ